jgi:hypothetical protein
LFLNVLFKNSLSLKQILSDILNILEPRERLKLAKLVIADLVMGVLDIAFLGMILVIVNFYTRGQDAGVISCLPAALVTKNS